MQFLNPWLPYDKKEHLKKRLFVDLVKAHPDLMTRGQGGAASEGSVKAPTQAIARSVVLPSSPVVPVYIRRMARKPAPRLAAALRPTFPAS